MSTTKNAASVTTNASTGAMRVILPGLLDANKVCTVIVRADGEIEVKSGADRVGDHEDVAIATRYALQALRATLVAAAVAS